MSKEEKPKQPQQIPFILHGIFGGTAGALGMCVVQPMDLIKTRMQLLGQQGQKGSMISVTRDVIRKEGFLALYWGLSCSVFRQYSYGLTRFTIFYNMFEGYQRKFNETPNVLVKALMGCVAGVFAAVAGNPAEVCLIRMTADGTRPPEKRRNYKHVFNALYRITNEEGLKTLWRGVEATMVRAAIVSAAELGSYTQARQMFLPYINEGVLLHFSASMVAGLIATTTSLPVDIVKTRVQNSSGGKASQITILKEILRKEGVLSLWSGFLPTYARLGPHAVLQFVIFEQFYVLYWKFMEDKPIVEVEPPKTKPKSKVILGQPHK